MSVDNSYISKDLTVKVKKDNVKLSTKPYVFKGDTGMVFEITVDNWNYYFDRSPSSEVDTFTPECKAMIEIVRPDGKLTKLMDVPIIDNEIHFRVNKNISDLVGIYQIFVKIMKGRVVVATIPPFDYEVKDKPYFNNILPMDRGFLQTEDETLLCYDTLDDYGIKHISELTKTETEKDEDELVLQQDGITTCITVGDFLKSTRSTAKEYTDTTATTIRGEVSDLDTEHKKLVEDTKNELTQLINQKDSSQSNALEGTKNELTELITEKDTAQTKALNKTKTDLTNLITEKDTAQTDALNTAKAEINKTISDKHKEAKGYTDTEVSSAKEHSDANLDTAKKYTNTKTTETLNSAKEYADAKLTEGKGYSDQKLVEANAHADTNLATGKEYTNTELVKAKNELKKYSDANLQTGKSYTDAEILKVNNTATTNLADAKKYSDDKLAESKAYSDEKMKELVGLAPEELNTIEELATAYKNNKNVLDATGVELSKKADKGHVHDIATESANGFMSKEDFAKLKGVADGANNYTHPKTHQASIIVQDATHRFITDEEREEWTNLKLDNVSIEGQEMVFKSKDVEKFRLKLPKGFSGDYNDLANKPVPYTLPIASDSILGGIKLGVGFEKQDDGTVNVVSGGKAESVDWSGIVDKPSEFNPKKHTHLKEEITDLFEVENELTSESETNALSVKQGKLIDDKVNILRNEYDSTSSEFKIAKIDISNLKSKAHTHANKEELDKITEGKVEEWDAKETVDGSQLKATKALNDSKKYADAKLVEAKSYSDTKLEEAKKYADSKVNYGNYRIEYNSVQDSLDFVYTPKQ